MKKYFMLIFTVLFIQTASGQSCNNSIPASTPQDRFIVNGDEATDKETRLVWRRCSVGQTGGASCTGNANTYTWQDALIAAKTERSNTGKEWRLPNANELRSIVEERCYYPAINVGVFPEFLNKEPLEYWTNSPLSASSSSYWSVEFNDGELGTTYDTLSRYVRLVRDAN